jgi:nicotinamide-nucleotide adenylyltransferase
VIDEISSDADELIIAIAASEDSGTETNPFTAEERGEMIGRALQGASVGAFIVVEVPDIHDPPRWAKYVESMVPPFDIVVAHNPQTLELFEDAGMATRPATPYRMDELSGTRVRRLLESGGQWEELVPSVVAEYLVDIDGPARLERIANST